MCTESAAKTPPTPTDQPPAKPSPTPTDEPAAKPPPPPAYPALDDLQAPAADPAGASPEAGGEGEGYVVEDGPVSESAVVAGAAAVGFGVGYLIVGPIGGICGAVGGALATSSKGKVGDVARSTGKGAVHGYRRGKNMWRRHKVGAKLAAGGRRACDNARSLDEKHKITDRVAAACGAAYSSCASINTKYGVSSKIERGFVRGLDAIAGQPAGGRAELVGGSADGSVVPAAVVPAAAPAEPVEEGKKAPAPEGAAASV